LKEKYGNLNDGKLYAAKLVEIFHPWWNNGNFSATRFFNWTQGGGLLIDKYPKYSYYSYPNVIEMSSLLLLLLIVLNIIIGNKFPFHYSYNKIFIFIWIWEVLYDICRCGSIWGTWTKNHVEAGHFWIQIKRLRFVNICCRFDWFLGKVANIKQKERRPQFILFIIACLGIILIELS
jgi:hypothetical protein